MKGHLDVGDPRQWWAETLEALRLLLLAYRPEHIAGVYNLAAIPQGSFRSSVNCSGNWET